MKGCSLRETRSRPAHSRANHSLHFAWQININEDYHVAAVHPQENTTAPPSVLHLCVTSSSFKKKTNHFYSTILICFLPILIFFGIHRRRTRVHTMNKGLHRQWRCSFCTVLSMSDKGPRLCWIFSGGTSQSLHILFWRNRLVPIKTHSVPPLKKGFCAAFWERRGWDNEEIILKGCREGGRTGTHTHSHNPYRDVLAVDSTIALQLATVSIESAHYEQITAFSFHSQSIDEHLFVWWRCALTDFELVCSFAIVSGSARLILDQDMKNI